MRSGLRLNSKKTEIVWIGAYAGRQDKLCPEKDIKWVTDKLKALGVWISSDPMVSMEANYNEKLLLHIQAKTNDRRVRRFGDILAPLSRETKLKMRLRE